MPERTKTKFQKSLTKYFDAELAEAVKHEKFMLRSKNIMFKRLLKAERRIRALPTITEQEVRNGLAALGLQDDVSEELMRQTILGFSQAQDDCFEGCEQNDEPVDEFDDVDDVIGEIAFDDVVSEEPEPVSEKVSEQSEKTTSEPVEEETVEKQSYWTTRRKNRTGGDNVKDREAVE